MPCASDCFSHHRTSTVCIQCHPSSGTLTAGVVHFLPDVMEHMGRELGFSPRMWSAVPLSPGGTTPPSRSKHSATLLGSYVYLLGGRNGNLPLKDLWRYSLEESRWELLKPGGDCPPCLQEHSAVAYRECIYVFGGELGFSAGNETPLWVYNIKNSRPPKTVMTPSVVDVRSVVLSVDRKLLNACH
ncbi:hypothetical protein J6590_073411 [Homalodisca vitripennis]|nr:hypothetical protein J6590_073411 [Homalodisca vitripennis]